MVLPAFFGE